MTQIISNQKPLEKQKVDTAFKEAQKVLAQRQEHKGALVQKAGNWLYCLKSPEEGKGDICHQMFLNLTADNKPVASSAQVEINLLGGEKTSGLKYYGSLDDDSN